MAEATPGGAASNADNVNNDQPAAAAAAAPPAKPTSKAAAQAAQMNKLREANNKYKNLLKMAKERIQQQEEELETQRRKCWLKCYRGFSL